MLILKDLNYLFTYYAVFIKIMWFLVIKKKKKKKPLTEKNPYN